MQFLNHKGHTEHKKLIFRELHFHCFILQSFDYQLFINYTRTIDNNNLKDSLIFNMISFSVDVKEVTFSSFTFNISEKNTFLYELSKNDEMYHLNLDGKYSLGTEFNLEIEDEVGNMKLRMFNKNTVIECLKFETNWQKIFDSSTNAQQ